MRDFASTTGDARAVIRSIPAKGGTSPKTPYATAQSNIELSLPKATMRRMITIEEEIGEALKEEKKKDIGAVETNTKGARNNNGKIK